MIDKPRIEKAVREILIAIGENPDRAGLVETPKRVAGMYEELFSGMEQDPREHFKVFKEGHTDEMIVVRDIKLYSMCEHHILPFYGQAHVVYIPNDEGEILGLSKVARIVETLSRKLQLQERLCFEIADAICEAVKPKGVCVVVEAEHMCMTMRGIKKAGSSTATFSFKGVFKENLELRKEALMLSGVYQK